MGDRTIEPSETGLIEQALLGDPHAAAALYDAHHGHIFRFVWSRVGERRAAEDLTGDVFLRMVAALPRYRISDAPFRAWLYAIARSVLSEHFRKEGQRPSVPLEAALAHADGAADPVRDAEFHLSAERVQRALALLDPPQRDVVALRFIAELTLFETAAALGRTEAAVKSLQHRGLTALRRALSADPASPGAAGATTRGLR